jgi:hypothetical protein
MSTINITYGQSKAIKHFDVPVISIMKLNANSLNIIKSLLQSTDSDVWLWEAEEEVTKLKNG